MQKQRGTCRAYHVASSRTILLLGVLFGWHRANSKNTMLLQVAATDALEVGLNIISIERFISDD